MSQTFEISYWWETLSEPSYFLEIVDATKISIALDYFLSLYEGQFMIRVEGHEACFDLRPDLSTIFEEIPLVLERLTTNTESPVEFDFFEQGTDVGMLMERREDKITICFETAPGSGQRFKFLPDDRIPVPANEFLEQWLQFIRSVLDALVKLQPELVNDESYQKYRTRLDIVESRMWVKTGS
jgi:hypothetical protein